MKKLFLTISWLEFIRNKNRSLLLLIIVIGLSLMLTTCGEANTYIHVSSDVTHSSNINQPGIQNSNSSMNLISSENPLSAIPAVLITGFASLFGFLVLMTIPFRGKEEWENGQFQMVAMGNFSFYKVELNRFLSYLSLAILFFLTILLCFSVYTWKINIYTTEYIQNAQRVAAYWIISFTPLMLAFGVLVSAINTAYYRDGSSRLLTLVKYLSCLSFFVLVIKTASWFKETSFHLLPVTQIPIIVPGAGNNVVLLNWDFPLLSLATTALFVFWSGRILEEVEA